MTADGQLRELAASAGIFPDFKDLEGEIRATGPETQRALLRACGIAAETPGEVSDSLAAVRAASDTAWLPRDVFATSGEPQRLTAKTDCDWCILADGSGDVLAQGRTRDLTLQLPALPSGVHRLRLEKGASVQEVSLLVSPRLTPSLQQTGAGDKTWGVVAALYGLHSRENSGPGSALEVLQLAFHAFPLFSVVGRRFAGGDYRPDL